MHIVKKIIDKWDPIGLFPYAPSDEYKIEIKKIEDILLLTDDVAELSNEIFNIFYKNFDNVFLSTKEECTEIATKILVEFNKSIL